LDAIVLAAAGLERMNMTDRATQVLAPDLMLPAIGQGALGIESRRDDAALNAILARLDHGPTAVAVTAERAYLATMEGSCQVPLGALASVSPDGRTVSIQAFVADPDGGRLIGGSESAPVEQAADAGRALGRRLLADGGRAILDDLLGPSSTR
jgi:hydroxymethylbilane synthase